MQVMYQIERALAILFGPERIDNSPAMSIIAREHIDRRPI